MGCDIHICLEVKKNGKWEPLVRMIHNKEYNSKRYQRKVKNGEHIFEWEKPEIAERIGDGRNYSLFAILADVRNGRGFAGLKTGKGFLPIAFPKGIPEDAHSDTREFLESFDMDGHSHSWHTLRDLYEYDWDMVTVRHGTVSAVQYAVFKINGRPNSWCVAVSGGLVKNITIEEMEDLYQRNRGFLDRLAKKLKDNFTLSVLEDRTLDGHDDLKSTFTVVQWKSSYREAAGDFVTHSIPRL